MSGFVSCNAKRFIGIGMHTCEKMSSRDIKNIYTWIERREHQAVSHVYILKFLADRTKSMLVNSWQTRGFFAYFESTC